MVKRRESKAVFLDRDGVLNRDSGYVYRPEDMILMPGVADGLKRLSDAGFLLIVVTNQSGVARGFYSLTDVDHFHAAMQKELEEKVGLRINRFYVCPHFPDSAVKEFSIECDCRKPGNRNILTPARELGLWLENCFLIGDKESDMEAGRSSGVRTVFCGGSKATVLADFAALNFSEAVEWIVSVPSGS